MQNPAIQSTKRALQRMSPAHRRDLVAQRLRNLANSVGGVSNLAALADINRSQLSRYLSGKSQPRPEILYDVSRLFGLPMEWFFQVTENEEVLKSELRTVGRFHQLIQGRKIAIDPHLMQPGFYRFWKGMFWSPGKYQCLLSHLDISDNVGFLKSSEFMASRAARKRGSAELFSCVCEGLVTASGSGINVLFIENVAAEFGTCFLQSVVSTYSIGASSKLAGHLQFMISSQPGRSQIVPVFMERVDASLSELKRINVESAQVFSRDEMPKDVLNILDTVNISGYGPVKTTEDVYQNAYAEET